MKHETKLWLAGIGFGMSIAFWLSTWVNLIFTDKPVTLILAALAGLMAAWFISDWRADNWKNKKA